MRTISLSSCSRLVEFQLERDNYREALRVLATQTQGPSGTEMIYEFSPPLMRHVPKLVVDVWISKGHQLNPHRFLPSLQRYNGPGMETEAGEIIRYLEHCIHVLGSTDNALHNYLVALYCRTNNEDALLAYLITADEESSRRSVEVCLYMLFFGEKCWVMVLSPNFEGFLEQLSCSWKSWSFRSTF